MKRIVFASGNKYKLEEIQRKLNGEVEIVSMRSLGFTEEIAETGSTLSENAALKATFIYNKYHCDTLADDSGLEIHALNGRPGVYSARYAGEACSYEDNNKKVLMELKSSMERSATFKTVFYLILNGKHHEFVGEIKGLIAKEPKGSNGFGYDPIFIPNGYDQTFAEMTLAQKNEISHRSIATEKLVNFLSRF